MGLGGISLWQLLIILLIVVVIFGTKRMRSIGSDLGGAVKGFRKAMDDGTGNGGAGNDDPANDGLTNDDSSQSSTQQLRDESPDADFSSSDIEDRERNK